MLRKLQYQLNPDPVCSAPYTGILDGRDFRYYDKDGFELTIAERLFYRASGHPVREYLNHEGYQAEWFKIDNAPGFYLDHSAILHRCSFEGEALDTVESYSHDYVAAKWLAQSKQKWGFDFAMEGVDENTGEVVEILHIEHDSHDFAQFVSTLLAFERTVLEMDWECAKQAIIKQRDQWQHLKGYRQNDWKAQYLIGWEKAETTEKAI